jgi:hypothetical protein
VPTRAEQDVDAPLGKAAGTDDAPREEVFAARLAPASEQTGASLGSSGIVK